MQREQARLRDLGGYSGPCSVRGYVSTVTPNTINLDRVYKEQGGVRISVARSIAPKVPSIKELILQLNRKQYGEDPTVQIRPTLKPRRKSLNSISSRLPDLSDTSRGSQSLISSRDLVIQVGDASPPPGVSSKGRSSPVLTIPNHRPKIPWRLSNNSQPSNSKLGGLMSIRHLSSEVPEGRYEGHTEEKIEDRLFLDRELEKSSSTENLCPSEGLDGLLVCSSIPQHKVSLSESMLSKMNLMMPSVLKRPRPHSSSLPPVNSSSNSLQSVHTSRLHHDSVFNLASEFHSVQPTRKASTLDSVCFYPDPMSRAPPTFHQRIIEISALESDTIRVERQKLLKKKKSHGRQD